MLGERFEKNLGRQTTTLQLRLSVRWSFDLNVNQSRRFGVQSVIIWFDSFAMSPQWTDTQGQRVGWVTEIMGPSVPERKLDHRSINSYTFRIHVHVVLSSRTKSNLQLTSLARSLFNIISDLVWYTCRDCCPKCSATSYVLLQAVVAESVVVVLLLLLSFPGLRNSSSSHFLLYG